MAENFNIVVLMSTYNGARYIREQLDSIFSQDYKNIYLLVRDDGSIDSTCLVLEEYSKKQSNMHYYKGKNMKPARSFMDLLKQAPDADYYAFADQDDVWLPNKLSKGIEALASHGGNLYHSNFQMTDADLNPIVTCPKPVIDDIGKAAVLYPATGCTMILTKKLRDIVVSYEPQFIVMHDTWIFKVALATCGPVVFDNKSYILYRQHSGNVLGGKGADFLTKWSRRIKAFLAPERTRWKEMNELWSGYSTIMDTEIKEVVYPLVEYQKYSLAHRFQIAFSPSYTTPIFSKNQLFRIALILKRY